MCLQVAPEFLMMHIFLPQVGVKSGSIRMGFHQDSRLREDDCQVILCLSL